MQEETEWPLIITIIIITIFAILLASRAFSQDLDPVTDLWGYELTFYSVEYDDSVLTVAQGDTLQIRWDAPTTRTPYDEQQDYPLKGNWTGVSLKILIQNDSVFYNGNSEFNRLVSLAAGKYELTIRAIDLNDNFSKESDGFLFEVVAVPPGIPARVYIIVGG